MPKSIDALDEIQAVHHQIGNSLQSVVSLLENDARSADPASRKAYRVAGGRVRVLMRLHRRLQVAVADAIRFDELAREIANDLAELHNAPVPVVRAEPVIAPSVVARKAAFVLAEMIANAFEHGRQAEAVAIDINQTPSEFRISVRNACDDATPRDFNGFGLHGARRLMQSLGGSLDVAADQGEVTAAACAPAGVVWRRADCA